MFQLFHADVAKVDRDVADVVMVVHVCCKRLSPMFHLSSFCMLQVLCLNISKVDRDIAYVAMVVHVCCKLLFPMFHLFF